MKSKIGWLILPWILSLKLNAQQLNYTPEIVTGHRSFAYSHQVNYLINKKARLNNLTFFDAEYKSDTNNIFFIRNTFSYNLTKKIAVNSAVGIKNPGAFITLSALFRIAKPSFAFSYSIGVTYQRGISLEQSISFEAAVKLTKDLQLCFNLLAIANIDLENYQRGIQNLRVGLKNKKSNFGFALNLDQFNNCKKTLANGGLFFKYNF